MIMCYRLLDKVDNTQHQMDHVSRDNTQHQMYGNIQNSKGILEIKKHRRRSKSEHLRGQDYRSKRGRWE